MSPFEKSFDIAVVGGGISGLTLATALLNKGIKTTLYEAAPKFGEIGAGVSFGPNAQRAMRLISPDVEKAFKKVATHNQWDSKKDIWFDFRLGDAKWKPKPGSKDGGLKGGDKWFALPCEGGQASVHRAHFLDEMVKLVPQEISNFGKRLVDVEKLDNGDVLLHFQDGTTAQHNAVIGCDGIKSAMRGVVLGKDNPATKAVFSGKYAYRGLIPMNEAVELLGEELAMNSQNYGGYGGHILTFAIEKGKTMNVVAFSSRDTWDSDQWVVSMTKEDMLKDFEGWSQHAIDIINLTKKSDVWALFNHPPAETYCKGRICLSGDAAHASTPHQGAGAGICIEDSWMMSEILAAINDKSEIEAAFKTFDAVRRKRTQDLVTTSRDCGQLYDFEKPGVMDDLDKYRENMAVRMKWLWEEDLEAQLKGAKEVLAQNISSRL
ncbi:FAD/NAD(P)-binding domain-containing protein [Pseudovirgaria hyperparasitica]|uniref:FAD/NAD(P)-binding domain-containing protein n=1 Tax=Pseudovirgaria hyperparasitica TaxID=470096 RepID=A0A6A6WFN4_9PEZI|nr:FAD/NAD(P)-binding domain-containing protein [Pseudovirgaria hyperparasitica]KAF2760820.1 FAD/NAD(P)-binding domain-containing protein [Pseudovirgaria hyperparasitica]